MEDYAQTHGSPAVGKRIVGRTLAAVWRQKQAFALGAVVLAGLGGYWAFGPGMDRSASHDPAGLAAGDCADTTIAALVDKTPSTVQQAYQCMDRSFQQRVSEQQFSSQITAAADGQVTSVERVGSHQEPNGSQLVYYALDTGNNQSVGYIVYLGTNGKVLRIE